MATSPGPDHDGAVQQRLDDAAAESTRADAAARLGDHPRARDLYQSAHNMVLSASTMHMAHRPESSVVNRAGSDAVNTALAATMGAVQHHADAPMREGSPALAASTNGAKMTVDGDCADCEQHGPEHFGPTGGTVVNKPWDGAASRFSDDQYKMATAVCDTGDGSVKERCHLPHHEPGGAINRNGVHAAAARVNQIQGGGGATAKAHLRSHYTQDLKEDPPDALTAAGLAEQKTCPTCDGSGKIRGGKVTCPTCGGTGKVDAAQAGVSADLASLFLGMHEVMSGTHAHAHSSYGSQGGDESHAHSHTHANNNLHSHEHPATAAAGRRPSAAPMFRQDGPDNWQTACNVAPLAADATAADWMRGAAWAVRQDDDYWHVLAADGGLWTTVDSYTEALDAISRQLAESGDTRPVLGQGWKSEMAFEGVPTGDGRFINDGAIEYRNCPMPLMLQTETSAGHQGAVLAGAITKTGKLGQVALGAGDLDASDAGKQLQQILQARGRFGVSIDVAEAEGQPQCPDHGADIDQCDPGCDWEIHFSLIRIMGLTATPFPAFENAYIELQPEPAQQEPVAAAATPTVTATYSTITPEAFREQFDFATTATEPIIYATTEATTMTTANGNGTVEWTSSAEPLAAAATKGAPPLEWFSPPDGWAGQMVRQPNGKMACPLTIMEPDSANGNLRRVFGHIAEWSSCHTGISGRCVTPPRSKTDYAGFNLRPLPCADGTMVRVGHLTMGCGHADTDPSVPVGDVRAHYDGGPGAVRMAHVRMGEDGHGPWVCGFVDPAVSEQQVRTFASCSLSGDWREVWRGKGLECVAVLAGVTVPGFPIAAAALIAAGVSVPMVPEIGPPRIGWRNEQPVSLVAAGVLRQPMPWERQIASLENRIADLADENRRLEATLAPLRPMAASAISEQMGLVAAAPTSQDVQVAECLQRLLSAAHETMEAQMGDPDTGSDPDDAAVLAHLRDLMVILDKAIVAQSQDGAAEPEPEQAPTAGSGNGKLPGIGHLLSRT